MKIFITLTISAIFFSCSAVKVAKISSEKAVSTPAGYVFENDTLKITYRFWAQKGRMEYDIYNKLSTPIYVDWKTSAFIPNDKMISYWQDETNTVGTAYTDYVWVMSATTSKTKSVRKERIGVIPPKAMVTQSGYVLSTKYTLLPAKGSYDKTNSPLVFRNYVTIAGNESFNGQTSTVDNLFYIQEIKTVSSSKYEKYKSPEWFYHFMSYSN